MKATVVNAENEAVSGRAVFTVAPAASGNTLGVVEVSRKLLPGTNLIETALPIEHPRSWDIHDPFLYRVSARVSAEGSTSIDENSVRCGFREFRFENGNFRLNGRRLFVRCSHSGADSPVGVKVPEDPNLLRRDLVNAKAMGFNMIRFIAGMPRRFQLDMCDEIGLMVYEESYASWLLRDSPQMAERFDRSTMAAIRRDRSHPSIVIWGLLNETGDGPIFRHAVESLRLVRSLDNSRLVMLGSGRFDCVGNFMNGLEVWRSGIGPEPNVTHNPKQYGICMVPLWKPGQVAMHPGADGEYSVVRWTAPEAGEYGVAAKFEGTGTSTTTDLHILREGSPIWESYINLFGRGNECSYKDDLKVKAGETIDFIVGWGGSFDYGGWTGCRWVDNTALEVNIEAKTGKTFNAASDFSSSRNPNGAWSYGYLPKGTKPDAAAFATYSECKTENYKCVGGLSNPGSQNWEDVLSDQHYYPRVPHRKLEISRLRTIGGNDHPLFLSEYGVGSSVNLVRLVRHFEQVGKTSGKWATECQKALAAFMADWERWKLADTFATPQSYFQQAVSKMAEQRRLGINALRSNPSIVGYSLTGTSDPFSIYGEGLTTAFRELKPGTVDAMFDALDPLRWCLFAEPVNLYRRTAVRLEAVLANEDCLLPGEYPARVSVVGPDSALVFDLTISLRIPDPKNKPEPPYALPVFSEDVTIDGPPGKYRFMATLERGGAAAGGEAEFYVTDEAEMPPIENEVVLWGREAELSKWLIEHGARVRPFSATLPNAREVILVAGQPPPGANVWRQLVRRIAHGSTAIFLSMAVFKKGDSALGWMPLAAKGKVSMVSEYTFPSVYPKDEWARKHPIFDGLPCGGLMDRTFYREIIPDARFSGLDTPAEAVAGAFRTSIEGYLSELMVSVHSFGAGRFILNALRIGETLGKDPVAERLLRNMLRYAMRDGKEPPAELPVNFDTLLNDLGYSD
jgi:hypothetical protein